MLASEIIQLARDWSFYTDTTQYTPTQALTDLNIVYRDIIAMINQDVNEDLFTNDFYTNTVNGQLEYTIPQTNNLLGINGMDNLLGVFVNYAIPVVGSGTVSTISGSNVITGVGTSFTADFRIGDFLIIGSDYWRVITLTSDTSMEIISIDSALPTVTQSGLSYSSLEANYQKCFAERLSNLQYDQSYYGVHQDPFMPFYIKYDTGIRIFPYPQNVTPGGVKLYGTLDVADLLAGSTPILDDNWQYVLAVGMKRFSYFRRGMIPEANQAQAEYLTEYKKMLNTISDTELSPQPRYLPLLQEFQ